MAAGQIVIGADQHAAVAEFLRRYGGAGDIVITPQFNGALVIAGELSATWEVSKAGTVDSDDGEVIEL